jgi:hypothetical protein
MNLNWVKRRYLEKSSDTWIGYPSRYIEKFKKWRKIMSIIDDIMPVKCPDCHSVAICLPPMELGDGKCANCGGTGKESNIFDSRDCLVCNGSGTCQTCNGSGEIED